MCSGILFFVKYVPPTLFAIPISSVSYIYTLLHDSLVH